MPKGSADIVGVFGSVRVNGRAKASIQGEAGVRQMAAKGGLSEIYDRYATALFELADEGKCLDAVANDLKALQKQYDDSEDLRRLVNSPVIDRDDQLRAVTAIADRMQVHDLTKKFVSLLASRRRLFAFDGIMKSFLEELARRRSEVTAEVTSARTLSDEQTGAIEAALRAAVGSKVAVNHHVDPDLIGGLVVRVGSRMVDSSLRTKLQKLSYVMKGA